MTLESFTTSFPCRTAGRAAIASGTAGIIAICCLVAFLVMREGNMDAAMVMERLHDAGVIFQFLLFIPVVYEFRKLLRQNLKNMSSIVFNIGVSTLAFTALVLLLGIIKFVSDGLYMLGQGAFGAWFIFVNWRMRGIISNWFRWFGIIVGFGLVLVGIFCAGYAIFVSTLILKIPAASAEEVQKIPIDTPANQILHQIIYVGSAIGVLTLPFWTLLLGWRLLSKKNSWTVS